jgi:hypothetical protein
MGRYHRIGGLYQYKRKNHSRNDKELFYPVVEPGDFEVSPHGFQQMQFHNRSSRACLPLIAASLDALSLWGAKYLTAGVVSGSK